MGNFDKKKFAELLALAKGNRSINQYALQCGVSSAHISRLLRGLIDTPPNPETIKKFASKAHNGVTYEELMEAAGHIDSSSQLTEQNQFYEFSQRLRQLREEKGLLQKDVAKILGITPSAYGYYEQGKREPSMEVLKKLSDFFNVSIDYLLGRTDIRSPVDEITEAVSDDPELFEFWNTLKEREDLKLLFKQTKKLSPKDIKQIIRIIKAIEDEEDKEE